MSPRASHALKAAIALVVILGIGGVSFWWGYARGAQFPVHITVEGVANLNATDGDAAADFGTFWQAWQLISEKHLEGKTLDPRERLYGAIRGLVRALDDPNSEFFAPADSTKFEQDIRGSFGGIGAEIGIRENKLVIVAPLKNTPASKAGLEPQDHVVQVDETPTAELAVDEAVKLIRGPEGTAVRLLILREGWDEPREFKITRARIVIPTLEYEVLGDVVHLELLSFNANALSHFRNAATAALRAGAKSMVLDLRNNPGGFLNVAVDLAGWFFPRGTLVVSEEGTAGKTEFRAQGNESLAEFPVVVIINGGSASASEILAGALRDQRNVKLVGTKSFGKGTVQEVVPLRDGSSLKLTIANWVLPSGNILADEGLEPDVKVEPTEEDTKEGRDPQLQKALEILRAEIAKGNP